MIYRNNVQPFFSMLPYRLRAFSNRVAVRRRAHAAQRFSPTYLCATFWCTFYPMKTQFLNILSARMWISFGSSRPMTVAHNHLSLNTFFHHVTRSFPSTISTLNP